MDITNDTLKNLEYSYDDLRRLFMRGAVMSYKYPVFTVQRMEEVFLKEMERYRQELIRRHMEAERLEAVLTTAKERSFNLGHLKGSEDMLCTSCQTTGRFSCDDEGVIRCDCGSDRFRILPDEPNNREFVTGE